MKKDKVMIWIAIAVVAGALSVGPIMSDVEQAKYIVVQSSGNIEQRDYDQIIVAETEVSGERKEAINAGFRTIADYIFGNNISAQKIAMTAPVIQQNNEKVSMTAPVMQQANNGKWQVRFVMPASYKLENLPVPVNKLVKIKTIPAKRFAVIRFSGMAGESSLDKHKKELSEYIQTNKLVRLGEPMLAFFNPPWTAPFLRRNEIMQEIEKQ